MSNPLPIGVPVAELRPTQMTCGFREVGIKRRQWREADEGERAKLLRSHVVPAVVGPKARFYIVDHHHFSRALLEEKAPHVAVYVVADLQHLAKGEFWTFLDNSDWCHAYDHLGERRVLSDIPKSLAELTDDPYRSLVGELIRAGGCAKSHVPFFEFLWADFLRRRIKPALVEKDSVRPWSRHSTSPKVATRKACRAGAGGSLRPSNATHWLSRTRARRPSFKP